MTNKSIQVDELVREFANRIGSPYGGGATYEPSRPKAAEEEYGDTKPNGNFSHLDDDDWQKFQDDLKVAIEALIQQKQLEARLGMIEYYDICFENGGVSKPMVDKLEALIQQKQLEARLDELNNVVLACEIDELSSLQPVGSYTKRRREEVKAQLSTPPKKEDI
jgi:hypothetical protein